MAVSRSEEAARGTPWRWLSLAVALGAFALALLVWNMLRAQEDGHIERETAAAAVGVRNEIVARTQARTLALLRVAKRWETQGQPSQAAWEADAALHRAHYPGYLALGWVDRTLHVRWIEPLVGNEAAVDFDITREPRRRLALEAARERRGVVLTRTIDLAQGGRGMIAYAPIFRDGDFDGFISGAFRLRPLLDVILDETVAPGYGLAVFDGNEEIYRRTAAEREGGQEVSVPLSGVTWRVRTWPTPELLAQTKSLVPSTVLAVGLVVAALLTWAVHLAQATRRRAAQLQATSEQLRAEVIARMWVEQELRQSERRFRAIFNHTFQFIGLLDADGTLLEANEPALAFRKLELADVVGRPVWETPWFDVSEDLRSRVKQAVAVAAAGTFVRTEIEVLGSEGSRETFDFSLKPVRDESGRVSLLIPEARNITDSRRTVEEIRRQREFSESLTDSSFDGILALDRACNITVWNPAMEKMSGVGKAAVLGKCAFDVFPFLKEIGEDTRLLEVLQGKTIVAVDRPYTTPERDRLGFFEGHYSPLRNGTGEVIGALCVIRDTTERRQAEEALRQAKEDAEAASRTKSGFLAMMSHEIRTPLNGIVAATALAFETPLPTATEECLRLIKSSADSLLTVIDDILDFSKIEADKLDFDTIEFDLRAGLGDTLKALAWRAHEKDLELVCDVAPEVPDALVGDPGRLRQVIVNLVGNAIKFTDRGEVTVRVGTLSGSAETVELHVAVTDTGIGIPAEKQQAIFKSFEQVDNLTTRRHGGTGLGLAISERLVGMMGGRLWVESELGRGSTFHATVRLGVACARASGHSAAGLQGIPVLVVDDNVTSRRVLETLLARWQMQPTTVDGVRAARAALVRARECGTPFRLALIDARMPDMDGFALLESLAEDPAPPPAIMMSTADRQPQDAARCLTLGASGQLVKPVQESALLTAIREALDAAPREDAPGASPEVRGEPRRRHIMVADECFDPARVLEMVEGNTDLLREIVKLFLDRCPVEMSQIRSAIARGDGKGLRLAAHSLKGAASQIGSAAVAERARRLELMGGKEDLTHGTEAYASLEAELERLKTALTSLA